MRQRRSELEHQTCLRVDDDRLKTDGIDVLEQCLYEIGRESSSSNRSS